MIIATLINVMPVYAENKNDGILIVYDAYNVYGNNDNILNSVNIMAMKTGEKVTILNMDYYKSGDAFKYESIIVIHNTKEDLPGKLKIDLKKFNGKQVGIGKKVTGLNLNIEDIMNESIKSENEILQYLNGKEELNYNKYFVLDNINAFMDLNKLIEEIDYINSNGIPFLLDVRPVYLNTDLKAMQRFTEALRYAQSKGGYIILDTPYIEEKSATTKQIIEAMTTSYNKFLEYNVYPIAFSIPVDLIYRGDINSFLENSNTIFLKNEAIGIINNSKFIGPKIKNIVTEKKYSNKDNLGNINEANNLAVYIKSDLDIKEFKNTVDSLIDEVNFTNPSNINSNIKIDDRNVKSNELGIYLNGVEVTQNRFISKEEFAKKVTVNNKEEIKQEELDISKFSNFVMILAGIACGIFIIIAILSRRIDRKKYFK